MKKIVYLRMPYLPRPQKKQIPNWSNSAPAPFLLSAAWRNVRGFYLMAHALCECCLLAGTLTDITGKRGAQIDHVIRREDGGALLDFRNLAALCRSCHAAKTAMERHGVEVLAIGPMGEKIPAPGEREKVFSKIKAI